LVLSLHLEPGMNSRIVLMVVASLAFVASPAFAQFPGEPKAPDRWYDPVREMTYVFERGAPNEIVRDAQRVLGVLGHYVGPLDGIMSPDVKAAIQRFQKAQALDVSLHLDRPTLAALGLMRRDAPYASPAMPEFGRATPPKYEGIEAP
jgi:hypothetical protein